MRLCALNCVIFAVNECRTTIKRVIFRLGKAPVRSHPTWRLVCYRRVNAWLACITSHQWANSVKGHKSG
ncbi:Uncharacterised protein [Vibrio cholerae]|nr:Uncharacterised protein [Vibrio cholerae]